jgi:hypothetical protein
MRLPGICGRPTLALAWALLATGVAGGIEVKTTQNTLRLMPFQVFEITFQHQGKYHNPTWDVTIDVRFTSPSGKAATVGGFFYGSSQPQKPVVKTTDGHRGTTANWPCDPADLWKARFAPSELGPWKYEFTFKNDRGESASGKGEFKVVKGRVHQRGFVRIDPENPHRFVFDDGSPFYPVGFQDGVFDNNSNGSVMDVQAIEGPFRPDPEGKRPKPPPGSLFARGPSMGPSNGDVVFGRHARAGFNLFRFSPNNFSIKVFAAADDPNRGTLDNVRWEQARMVDELLLMNRKYGIRNFYGLFGYHPVFNDHPENREGMAKVKRLVKYSVDRWGAYVDFWEFLNEQKAGAGWYAAMIPYLRSIDPYHHPITTSWERPELDGIELNAPHWYGNENELSSDQVTASRAKSDKRHGKPVIYGEQGNSRGKEDLTAQGIGGVWDPGSARRMRVRLWTAMFNETSLVFWETSYAKDGHYMNLWIGPEERQYVHALQDFAYRLGRGIKMAPVVAAEHRPAMKGDAHDPPAVTLAGPQAKEVRGYALRGPQTAAVYLHHFGCAACRHAAKEASQPHPPHRWDHDRGEVRGLQVSIDVPKAGKGHWYNPVNADILARVDAPAGRQTFAAPPFAVDLALLITDGPAPDIDGDGIPNDLDDDDDNDGVPDARDAFPLEREEWADVDQDRIGDNHDADIDGDGVADDLNHNGIPDNEEPDWDGDGVPQAGAIPWDAFPRDPKEWRDTDGDGIGDNSDPDIDGDGYSNEEERRAGTDPFDPLSFPDR